MAWRDHIKGFLHQQPLQEEMLQVRAPGDLVVLARKRVSNAPQAVILGHQCACRLADVCFPLTVTCARRCREKKERRLVLSIYEMLSTGALNHWECLGLLVPPPLFGIGSNRFRLNGRREFLLQTDSTFSPCSDTGTRWSRPV